MSSFITDLPFKNSFIALEYNNTNKFHGNKRTDNQKSNLYTTLHTNPKINFRSNFKQDSFLSRTDRFQRLSEDKILNPGPGTYQLSSMFISINNSLSSKGYGVGFASKNDRFQNRELEKEKYSPGPGEYKHEKFSNLNYLIQNSLQGQSLFTTKETKSKKAIDKSPGPWSYNPIKTEEIVDPLQGPSFHELKTKRFKLLLNNIPGPGTYNGDWNTINKEKKISFFFKKPKMKNVDQLQKYQIKTEVLQDTTFQSKQNHKEGHLLKAKIHSTIFDSKNNQLLQIGKYTHSNQINEEIYYKLSIEKKDIFELAAPRWKKSKHRFRVPGPAFYCPKISRNKLSFNKNNNTFLCSPGVLFRSTAPYPANF